MAGMKNSERFRDLEKTLAKIRSEYHFGKLCREDLLPNPLDQFAQWFLEAAKRRDAKAHVMVLSTAGGGGASSRCVLLKGLDERGFLFYTNTQSRKARDFRENPQASACFYWAELERQVIVTGRVKQIPRKETLAYFHSRPREAQIAAWCTEQNRVIENREVLDRRFAEMKKKFVGREIPLNPHWAGFRLQPEAIEFWQGRVNRLNDRFRYHSKAGKWVLERLEP